MYSSWFVDKKQPKNGLKCMNTYYALTPMVMFMAAAAQNGPFWQISLTMVSLKYPTERPFSKPLKKVRSSKKASLKTPNIEEMRTIKKRRKWPVMGILQRLYLGKTIKNSPLFGTIFKCQKHGKNISYDGLMCIYGVKMHHTLVGKQRL